MDWNKSNTILIIAFIILNIFLLFATFSNMFKDDSEVIDEEFINNVENLLETKNIKINCEIPKDKHFLPIIEVEFHIFDINNELVQYYLGNEVTAKEGVYLYSNEENQTLEIIDGKKIVYNLRNKFEGKIEDDRLINQYINLFIEEKSIDKIDFVNEYKYVSNSENYIRYTNSYNNLSIDNSYMIFYVDKKGVYKFETQKIDKISGVKGKIKTISAIDSLPRLVTYDTLKDKEIVDIEISYYSIEDENWKDITKTNSDPTWKVVFSDGTQKHLPNYE